MLQLFTLFSSCTVVEHIVLLSPSLMPYGSVR